MKRVPEVCSAVSASRRAPPSSRGGCPHINLQVQTLWRVHPHQKSKIKNSPQSPQLRVSISAPRPRWFPAASPPRRPYRRPPPRMPHRNLRPASSGRTTLLLAALAAATRRGEFCAVVDASDALDPQSAAAAGVELDRLLWVRCSETHRKITPNRGIAHAQGKKPRREKPILAVEGGIMRPNRDRVDAIASDRLEQVLRATDLLLESGGFGLIILDLGDLPPQSARRIPLDHMVPLPPRRRKQAHDPASHRATAIAGSCSSLLLQLGYRQ